MNDKHCDEKMVFRSLLKNLPVSFYWQDENGILQGCSDKVLQDLGLPDLKHFIGRHCSEVVTELAWKNSQQVMASKKALSFEEDHLKSDGKYINYLSIKAPILNDDQYAVGLIGISIDITDSKRVIELQKEKEFAEKSARFMESISGSIAHELRTPLAIVATQIDLLNLMMFSDKVVVSEQKDFFHQASAVIKKTINAASYMISNILLKLRGLSTNQVDKTSFSERSICDDVENLLKLYPFESGEKELVKFNRVNDFKYFGNETLTEHMLFNLVKNALRAIREVDRGKITIKLENDGEYNKLIFTDTSLGIAKEFLPKIFNQFETKEKSGKGTGLGLAFCKLVMQSYGGDITCDSKEHKYTEFTLSFPRIAE